jgi:uncharacterized protein (TIGR02145 family)
MCYNLGATTTADPFTFVANTSTILGNFYQWGRLEALARTAAVPANFTKSAAYPYDWTIPAGYTTTTPLSTTYHQDDYLWQNHKVGTQDPCPTGWHVPSQSAFGSIFKGTADADVPGNATVNTWDSSGRSWSWYSATSYGNGGYAVKPDGSTTTLFFPAAGTRGPDNGEMANVGSTGNYWSSTTASVYSFHLHIDRERVAPAYVNPRGGV